MTPSEPLILNWLHLEMRSDSIPPIWDSLLPVKHQVIYSLVEFEQIMKGVNTLYYKMLIQFEMSHTSQKMLEAMFV